MHLKLKCFFLLKVSDKPKFFESNFAVMKNWKMIIINEKFQNRYEIRYDEKWSKKEFWLRNIQRLRLKIPRRPRSCLKMSSTYGTGKVKRYLVNPQIYPFQKPHPPSPLISANIRPNTRELNLSILDFMRAQKWAQWSVRSLTCVTCCPHEYFSFSLLRNVCLGHPKLRPLACCAMSQMNFMCILSSSWTFFINNHNTFAYSCIIKLDVKNHMCCYENVKSSWWTKA